MRKRNSVKQLNKVSSHRKAMMRNMASDLFRHERIITTRARGKVLKSYADRLITRAKKTTDESSSSESKLHNKRELFRHIKDREIATKLMQDIAPRFAKRSGGYTRMIHLPDRLSDSAKMSVVELVERVVKPKAVAKPAKGKKVASDADTKKKTAAKGETDTNVVNPRSKDSGGKKKKWFWGFKKKGEDYS